MDVADEQQRRAWRRAWIIPLAAMSVAGAAATALRDAGVSPPQVMSVCFFVGAMGGAGWQVLNRRDFVDRFFGWSLMLAVVMLLIALPGVESSAGGGAGALPGVVVGVVLTEGWMRLTARSARDSASVGGAR
ncbi:hypothetical protein [Nocardioides sp. AN3]